MSISRIEIGDLPFYNADVEGAGDPAAVVEFKAAIRAADGVIIATPEYNDAHWIDRERVADAAARALALAASAQR
jgi:hypothetical protein